MLDNFIDENEKKINKKSDINIIEIKNKINLKPLKQRVLLFKDTINTINYNFFENSIGYTKNNNDIVYISNIILNKFLLNITPLGLKKITKEKVLGIDELNKKKKELIMEEEKQQKKKNPSIDVGIEGPGAR